MSRERANNAAFVYNTGGNTVTSSTNIVGKLTILNTAKLLILIVASTHTSRLDRFVSGLWHFCSTKVKIEDFCACKHIVATEELDGDFECGKRLLSPDMSFTN